MISSAVILSLVFLSTLLVLLYINTERKAFAKRAQIHINAKQSVHTTPTPRVGGLAIAVGILSGALLSGDDLFAALLWSVLPIFIVGLLEDLGPQTPPALRLGVASLSAVLAIFVLGAYIHRLDLAAADWLLGIPLVAIAFSVFASAGMTHAMNLVDGLNGLSSAVVISIMGAFGYVAWAFGHPDLLFMNLTVCTAFLGFMCVNFPHGKIFLGDAGAYSVGHLIAWNAILLLNREPEVSAWGILLILLWPVLDTVFAMARRLAAGKSVSQPDRLHYHHVLMRLVLLATPKSVGLQRANPIGSVLSWPLVAAPCVLGILFISNIALSIASVFLFTMFYVTTYLLLIRNALKVKNTFS
jgi:UDP-N-acetylmuramyl pentapeptide phosphotransferase/UDP-N-acetylglucosamine-1-phosphate transferase